jgi:hypothetical protein
MFPAGLCGQAAPCRIRPRSKSPRHRREFEGVLVPLLAANAWHNHARDLRASFLARVRSAHHAESAPSREAPSCARRRLTGFARPQHAPGLSAGRLRGSIAARVHGHCGRNRAGVERRRGSQSAPDARARAREHGRGQGRQARSARDARRGGRVMGFVRRVRQCPDRGPRPADERSRSRDRRRRERRSIADDDARDRGGRCAASSCAPPRS